MENIIRGKAYVLGDNVDTDALNMAIGGWLKPGDHAVCTAMDHNSILRPLNELARRGIITQTRVAADPATGIVNPRDIAAAIGPSTRLVAVGHASNVTGTVQNISEIGRLTRKTGAAFLVDAAQTAGHLPLDVQRDNIDFLAAPGHKGLLGPLGTGFLYIRPGLQDRLSTIRQGGTGSVSDQDIQPAFMPDKFEPGSHNALGIAGLSAGIAWILKQGIELRTIFVRPTGPRLRRSAGGHCRGCHRPDRGTSLRPGQNGSTNLAARPAPASFGDGNSRRGQPLPQRMPQLPSRTIRQMGVAHCLPPSDSSVPNGSTQGACPIDGFLTTFSGRAVRVIKNTPAVAMPPPSSVSPVGISPSHNQAIPMAITGIRY